MSNLTHMLKARVDAATYVQITNEAQRSERSVGAVIRAALREHIAKSKRARS